MFHQGFTGRAEMGIVGIPTTRESSDDADHITMLIDSGASGHYFNVKLHPDLRGTRELQGTRDTSQDSHRRATRLTRNSYRHGLWGDRRRERQQTSSGPSGISRTSTGYLSSVLGTTGSGLAIIIDSRPRLEQGQHIQPLQQLNKHQHLY